MVLSIRGFNACIAGVSENMLPENIRLFILESVNRIDCLYNFTFVEELPQLSPNWKLFNSLKGIDVFCLGHNEARKFIFDTIPYALSVEESNDRVSVFFLKSCMDFWHLESVFMALLMPERFLFRNNCYILHTSYLVYKDKAVLFTGPSGVGKSTQSNLWCDNISKSHIVNGDRCLLSIEGGVVYANPYPVCGSSKICKKERYEVSCIVFITHALNSSLNNIEKSNNDNINIGDGIKVVLDSVPVQFKKLSSQITFNRWNKEMSNSALDFIQKLLSYTTVLNFHCDLTPNSPNLLFSYIFGGSNCKS